MKKYVLAVLVVTLAVFSSISLNAKDYSDPVKISHAYAFATAENQMNGAVFLTIENVMTLEDAKLLSAQTEVSNVVELHTHTKDETTGAMAMRKVDSITVPKAGQAKLEPMRDHIMLMGLKAPLAVGQTFPLTLNFENAEPIVVQVNVVEAGAIPSHE